MHILVCARVLHRMYFDDSQENAVKCKLKLQNTLWNKMQMFYDVIRCTAVLMVIILNFALAVL